MPKQRRRPTDAPAPPVPGGPAAGPGGGPAGPAEAGVVDPDVARFAAALKESARRDAEAKKAVAAERRRAEEQAAEAARVKDLDRSKDEAAARLRDARRSGRGIAEAEAAYKAALAAVVAAETGSRPAWAPEEPVVDEPAVPDDADPAADVDADPAADVDTNREGGAETGAGAGSEGAAAAAGRADGVDAGSEGRGGGAGEERGGDGTGGDDAA